MVVVVVPVGTRRRIKGTHRNETKRIESRREDKISILQTLMYVVCTALYVYTQSTRILLYTSQYSSMRQPVVGPPCSPIYTTAAVVAPIYIYILLQQYRIIHTPYIRGKRRKLPYCILYTRYCI